MHFPLSLSPSFFLPFPGGGAEEASRSSAQPKRHRSSAWRDLGGARAGDGTRELSGFAKGAAPCPSPLPLRRSPHHHTSASFSATAPGRRGGRSGEAALPPSLLAVALLRGAHEQGTSGVVGGGVAEDDSGGGHGGGGPRSGRRRPRGWRGSRCPQGPSHLELPLQRGSELMVVASPVAGALPLPSDARGSLSPLPFDTRISLSPISSSTGANRGDGPRSARPQPHGHALLPRPFTDEECVAKIGYANLGWSRRKPS